MTSLLPSQVRNDYWIHAVNPNPIHQWTDRSGKWLIFVPLKQLDEKWKLIASATEAGELGIAAKAATSKPNGLAKNKWVKVICVYTYDSADQADVMRVRAQLRALGFGKKLSYKTDQATTEGRYRSSESGPVSLYFE
jgi:hypothetical protein